MTTNAIYDKRGTTIVFKASGGDVVFTPKAVANAAGRLSARADLGAFPRPGWFTWYAETQAQATPTVGNLLRIYLGLWHDDDTPGDPDGGVGAADAAFATENDLKNLKYIGRVTCDTAAADTVFQRSGLVWIPTRYCSVVWWNALGSALTNDDGEHIFKLTPYYRDVQAPA